MKSSGIYALALAACVGNSALAVPTSEEQDCKSRISDCAYTQQVCASGSEALEYKYVYSCEDLIDRKCPVRKCERCPKPEMVCLTNWVVVGDVVGDECLPYKCEPDNSMTEMPECPEFSTCEMKECGPSENVVPLSSATIFNEGLPCSSCGATTVCESSADKTCVPMECNRKRCTEDDEIWLPIVMINPTLNRHLCPDVCPSGGSCVKKLDNEKEDKDAAQFYKDLEDGNYDGIAEYINSSDKILVEQEVGSFTLTNEEGDLVLGEPNSYDLTTEQGDGNNDNSNSNENGGGNVSVGKSETGANEASRAAVSCALAVSVAMLMC